MNPRPVVLSLMTVLALTLSACTTARKCPNAALVNPVFEKDSCKVRTRNVFVADSIGPELRGKIRDNPAATIQWVGTLFESGTIIPGHFIILNADKAASK
jgi:hypothetical protein